MASGLFILSGRISAVINSLKKNGGIASKTHGEQGSGKESIPEEGLRECIKERDFGLS